MRWLVLTLCPLTIPASGQSVPPFEFHNSFWTNLHHYLYQQARDKADAQGLSADEAAVWDRVLQYYKRSMVPKDLLRDAGMRWIDTTLEGAQGSLSLDGGIPVDDDLIAALNQAAPVYRRHWWTAAEGANRAWIDMATPLIRRFGRQMVERLATAYEEKWPPLPIRVDVATYANWAGGYTFTERSGRVHTLVASTSADYQGFAALEMLFHEATHGFVDDDHGRIADEIARLAKAAPIKLPQNLVHVMIFFTAGELTRRASASAGAAPYEPFGEKAGLYARAGWIPYVDAIRAPWTAHLDGRLALEDALKEIIAALKTSSTAR